MKYEYIDGHSSFAHVRIIPYTLHPILPVSRCTYILQSGSMVLWDYIFVWWNQAAPPIASHLCTRLEDDCWMSGLCCHPASNESQPWKLYFATLGGCLSLLCPHALPYPLPITCCLAFPYSSTPEPGVHICWGTFQPTVAESFQHYWHFPKTARSQKFSKYLQLLSAGVGVHLKAVSDGSVPG